MRGSGCARLSAGDGERAQRLVLDVDQIDGELRRGLVARDDGGHRIADEADLVAAQGVLVVADRQNAVRNRKRVAGQHQVDAVDLRGSRRVHAARCVRAAASTAAAGSAASAAG